MDEQKPNQMSFAQVISLVDQLDVEERKQIGRWLDFKSWDAAWDSLKQELTETRAAQGLPPPTDEDIHDEIDARRTPEQLEALRREVEKAEGSELIDAEVVFAKLTQHAEQWKSDPPRTAKVFKFVKALSPEEQDKLRSRLGDCW